MTEKLPPEIPGSETLKVIHAQAQNILKENLEFESSFQPSFESEQQSAPDIPASDSDSSNLQEQRLEGNNEVSEVVPSTNGGDDRQESSSSSYLSTTAVSPPNSENNIRSQESSRPVREGETSVIEQFERGVYITAIVIPDGSKVFKRVRFRYES